MRGLSGRGRPKGGIQRLAGAGEKPDRLAEAPVRLPAAEGEGASAALRPIRSWWVGAERRAASQMQNCWLEAPAPSAGPLAAGRGFSRPLLLGDYSRGRKEARREMSHPA
jgi:hypothetical protein